MAAQSVLLLHQACNSCTRQSRLQLLHTKCSCVQSWPCHALPTTASVLWSKLYRNTLICLRCIRLQHIRVSESISSLFAVLYAYSVSQGSVFGPILFGYIMLYTANLLQLMKHHQLHPHLSRTISISANAVNHQLLTDFTRPLLMTSRRGW